TGRDGIHGATFSSAELTDTHADEFAHAVQIGNAITEKRCLDAMLRARDEADGCLYTAVTDCGAGGLSSAVGEMGERVGAEVSLDEVPLKYAGLRYDEIWISEAQERMVLAVPPEHLERLMRIMDEEEVEATVIGKFGNTGAADGEPRLVVRYGGRVVADLRMSFLHDGLPAQTREASWQPTTSVMEFDDAPAGMTAEQLLERVRQDLAAANTVGRHWIIRGYDHEVQGGSVIKPLCGPGRGPSDAAVLRPRLNSDRGLAVGCGMAPALSDHDPYWMAVAAIDEAVRNVVCVGGDPARTAVLDNFCWGRTDDTRQLGGLVRACQACYDVAKAYGIPFVSGKDSLNNEFALQAGDVPTLLETLEAMAVRPERAGGIDGAAWPAIAEHVRRTQRLRIPDTLLISAISLIDDVHHCVTPDLKQPGAAIVLIGGLPRIGLDLVAARAVHNVVARALRSGLVSACHDSSEEGWLNALAEMAFAGNLGVDIAEDAPVVAGVFAARCAGYVVETKAWAELRTLIRHNSVTASVIGATRADQRFALGGAAMSVDRLRAAWSGS
ncbi:MAG: phosphoribosylformylglycinamidine synthase subunit PurL, partial [Phycisphaerae bacterium]|nr:phosphoribosylformylglycinamidine synthase subunit PurL [Phycisphaerae bacterium]